MLLLPLARSVLRLNKLEGGRLKSERDPRERELSDAERADPAGLWFGSLSGSSMAGCGTFSLSKCFSCDGGGGGGWGDAEAGFDLLCCLSESGWGRLLWGGVGLKLDGVAGSWAQGTMTAERLPEIRPKFCTTLARLMGLRWKCPSIKTQEK